MQAPINLYTAETGGDLMVPADASGESICIPPMQAVDRTSIPLMQAVHYLYTAGTGGGSIYIPPLQADRFHFYPADASGTVFNVVVPTALAKHHTPVRGLLVERQSMSVCRT